MDRCPLARWLLALLQADSPLGVRHGSPRLGAVAQAAERTGMSRRWFYDHSSEPFIRKLGRSYRVDLDALEGWMGGTRADTGPRTRVSSQVQTQDFGRDPRERGMVVEGPQRPTSQHGTAQLRRSPEVGSRPCERDAPRPDPKRGRSGEV